MVDIVTTWLGSIIDNAPYLAGAAIAIGALWRELRQCHVTNQRLVDRLLDELLRQRQS